MLQTHQCWVRIGSVLLLWQTALKIWWLQTIRFLDHAVCPSHIVRVSAPCYSHFKTQFGEIIADHHGMEKEWVENHTLAINASVWMWRVISILFLLSKVSHMATPDLKWAGKYHITKSLKENWIFKRLSQHPSRDIFYTVQYISLSGEERASDRELDIVRYLKFHS